LTLYKLLQRIDGKGWLGRGKRVEEFYQPAEVVLGDARRFIEANSEGPWALFVHLMEPHDPYFSHPYLKGTGSAEFDGYGVTRTDNEEPDPSRADELKALYADEITHLDHKLAPFLDWMRTSGHYDNTLIVLTADHGEEFFEHGGWWHGLTLFEEQIHVPLIVKLPGQELAGTRVPWQVRQLDVCPTAVAAQGLSPDESWDGADLLVDVRAWLETPARADDPCAPPDPFERDVISEVSFEGNVLSAARQDRWKLIRANAGNHRGLPELALYDLSDDPGESSNRVGDDGSDCGVVVDDRRQRMDTHLRQRLSASAAGGEAATASCVSDSALQQLVALGYLEPEAVAEARARRDEDPACRNR